MPSSSDVRLPRKQKVFFPPTCVSCRAGAPDSGVTVWTLTIGAWSYIGILAPLAFLGSRPARIRIPACRGCAWRLRFRRLAISALEIALVVAGCAAAHALFPGVKGLAAKLLWAVGAVIFVFPALYWQVAHPPAFELTATEESMTYEFRDPAYALEFAQLNPVEENVSSTLGETFPLEEYVKIFGPLHWGGWVKSLEGDPGAHAELKALVEKAEAEPREGARGPILEQMVACIRRHKELDRRVGLEHRIQRAHFRRQILNRRRLAAPEAKSAEWEVLYERLKEVLGRHAPDGTGVYLVDDEVEEPGHKIELSKPELLTREFLNELQAALGGLRNEWYVVLQLDFQQESPGALPGMMVVWRERIEETWDRAQLRSVLGPRFKL